MAKRRKREEIEARLVSEWVARTFKRAQVHIRPWLGELPPAALAAGLHGVNPAMYQVAGKWADAVVLTDDEAYIVEGKLKLNPGALGQVIVYRDMFRKTERYREWWDRPVVPAIVYAYGDATTEAACQARGVKLYRYQPPWVAEAYLKRAQRAYTRGGG